MKKRKQDPTSKHDHNHNADLQRLKFKPQQIVQNQFSQPLSVLEIVINIITCLFVQLERPLKQVQLKDVD